MFLARLGTPSTGIKPRPPLPAFTGGRSDGSGAGEQLSRGGSRGSTRSSVGKKLPTLSGALACHSTSGASGYVNSTGDIVTWIKPPGPFDLKDARVETPVSASLTDLSGTCLTGASAATTSTHRLLLKRPAELELRSKLWQARRDLDRANTKAVVPPPFFGRSMRFQTSNTASGDECVLHFTRRPLYVLGNY